MFAVMYRKKLKPCAAAQALVRHFAVKVLDRKKMEDLGVAEEDVQREARILGSMHHENIVRYVNLEETGEEIGNVSEFMAGGSIADFITKHPDTHAVPTAQVLKMMMQIAGAMDYIHAQGIIHRDIKSDNILFAHAYMPGSEEQMCIKLANFGVAVVLATNVGSARISVGGEIDLYFAQERGNGESCGAMADIFALGCVLC